MQLHILVVDDDPDIQAVLTLVLEDNDYSVEVAPDGRQALDAIAARPPDLILLDLNLPILSGWDVHAAVQQQRPTIPVVFMTAGFNARHEAQRCGAQGYLAKPFELDELLAVVQRCAA